jgi:hypothetical protein
LKQALSIAQRDYKEIYRATRGVIFLGTPHRGSKLSWLARFIATLAIPFGSNKALLNNLKYHSKDLEKKTDDFSKSCQRMYIACFYEKLPMYLLGISLGLVSMVI